MALSPLATLTDLLTRGVDTTDTDRALAAWNQPPITEAAVTFIICGLAEVPADVVNLVCDLAQASLLQEAPVPAGVTSIAIDDYRESYATGADAQVSVFEIPERTRAWLRQRFGATSFVVRERQ